MENTLRVQPDIFWKPNLGHCLSFGSLSNPVSADSLPGWQWASAGGSNNVLTVTAIVMVCLLSPPAAGWSTWFCSGRWNQEVSCLGTTLVHVGILYWESYGIFAWHILRNCFGNCSTLFTQGAHLVLAKPFQCPSTVHNTFLTLYLSGNQVSRELAAKAACSLGSLLCSEELVWTFITKNTQELR